MSLPLVDLRHLPASDRQLAAQQIATESAQRPFNLASVPLLRVKLLQLDETEYVLLLNLHHIVSDGWSLGVLIRELGTFYTAFRRFLKLLMSALYQDPGLRQINPQSRRSLIILGFIF